MNEQQVITLCSNKNDKLNIRLNCLTDAITNKTEFIIQGTIR